MPDKKYIDIKVVDGGWQIDAGQQPTQCSGLYSIAQDIKHSIMESGLARELIAERSPVLRSDVLIQIEQLAEQDIRIIPGTATATEAEAGNISLTADTYEYGDDISITVGEVEIKTIILEKEPEPPRTPVTREELDVMIANGDDVTNINTSQITNMNKLFKDFATFDQDISRWDVSNVIDMGDMFFGAASFNQDISNWDVSSVNNMTTMFYRASKFNQDIGEWDVSKVIRMDSMFRDAAEFNQDIGKWDVSSAYRLDSMFKDAAAFNQDIGKWDVSSGPEMAEMFYYAAAFNQNLKGWDVSMVASEPSGFSFYSALQTYNKPIWGTDGGDA